MSLNSKMSTLVSHIRCDWWRVRGGSHADGDGEQVERKVRNGAGTRPRWILTCYTVLQRVAGKDASKQFWKYHNEGILKKYKGQLQIGSLDTKKQAEPAPAPAPKKAEPKPQLQPASGDYKPPATAEPQEPYGDLIPFADPSWYQGVSRAREKRKSRG